MDTGVPPADRRPRVASTFAGVIEVVGQLSTRELFVSGWARNRPVHGASVVLLSDGRATRGALWLVRSDRPDVGPSAGFSGVIEFTADLPSPRLDHLLFEDGSRHDLFDAVRLVDLTEAVALLRTALRSTPTGEVPPALERNASRYAGCDTLSPTGLPIRLGVDDCAMLGENALLVSGWLFDPEHLVRTLHLATASESQALGDGWVRQVRPDVTASMHADPRFAHYPSGHECHGFVALATMKSSHDDLHLSLDVAASMPLHLPLNARIGRSMTIIRRFVGMMPPHESSSLDIVDRLVAPVLAAIAPDRARLLRIQDRDFPDSAPLTIVIGCSGDCADLPALFAILAATSPTPPIIVAGEAAELDTFSGDIERSASAYGLSVRLAFGDDVDDGLDALNVGVESAGSTLVCLLTMDAIPREPGWLAAMMQAVTAAGRPSVVVPNATESGSPAAFLPTGGPSAFPGCCVLARSTFLELGGFPTAFLSRQGKVAAVARQVEQAGMDVIRADQARFATAAAIAPASELLARRADRRAAELRDPSARQWKAG